MRSHVVLGAIVLAASLGVWAACAGGDDADGAARVSGPRFAVTPGPDLDGLPDLIVDAKRLARTWGIGEEEATSCTVQEGGVTPGLHRVLRFTATTPNIGTADVFVGNPLDHVAANDGTFEFATCHNHFHFRNYATYELISAETGAVIQAAKRGFCMVDVTRWHGTGGSGKRTYETCGSQSTPGFQGISVGWADSYARSLDGQFFVIDGVTPGDYALRVTVNPAFTCGPDDGARPRDESGACHMFAESDYGNNVGEALITITDRNLGNVSGPGGSEGLTADELASILTKTHNDH
jgi:hypothetical protein